MMVAKSDQSPKQDSSEDTSLRRMVEAWAYLDLEVDGEGQIFSYGFSSASQALKASPEQADQIYQPLAQLQLARGLLCGHNIRRFDHPHLLRQWPDLSELLIIDTLELSILEFPLEPSHRLQKDYKLSDYASNDPLEDARATGMLLEGCLRSQLTHPLFPFHHWLLTCGTTLADQAYQQLFNTLGQPTTEVPKISTLPNNTLIGIDTTALTELWQTAPTLTFDHRLAIAALLAWNQARHDAHSQQSFSLWLNHLPIFSTVLNQLLPVAPAGFTYQPYFQEFGIEAFRSPQEQAVQAIIAEQNPLILMPTGGGKSLCYQLPALMHYRRQRGLTVCLSPLQALMADQVADLESQGLNFATFVNSTLPAQVRAERMEALRNGEKGLLYISPEQLRSISIRTLLRDRPPALWVIDEAHCISQWGHDFRPDYRYIPKFIQALYAEQNRALPSLALLTATATDQVRQDIQTLFAQQGLTIHQEIKATMTRENLNYQVIPVKGNKESFLIESVHNALEQGGCALVYTTTRREAVRLAHQLQQTGFEADYYHGQLSREQKHKVLTAFKRGELNVVTATCAFGMGINRKDVRAVIHYTPSGSLESYVQEAGRAGRDQDLANCVLLFDAQDTETIFLLKSLGRLSKTDLRNIFTAVRQVRDDLSRQRVTEDWFWVTGEEIYQTSELDESFANDNAYRETKIRVALHHLETFGLLERAENLSTTLRFHLHPTTSVQAWQQFLDYSRDKDFKQVEIQQFEKLIYGLYLLQHVHQRYGEILSLERLSDESGIAVQELSARMRELSRAGICATQIPLTFLITKGVTGDARLAYERYCALEEQLLEKLVSLAEGRQNLQISLRALATELAANDSPKKGQKPLRASTLVTILEGWQSLAWIQFRPLHTNAVLLIATETDVGPLDKVIDWLPRHQRDCHRLLECLYALIDEQAEQKLGARLVVRAELEDLLVRFCLGQGQDQPLQSSLAPNPALGRHKVSPYKSTSFSPSETEAKQLKRILRWLHEREFLRLTDGLMLFHQALKVRVIKGANIETIDRQYPKLEKHYAEQARRTHLMVKYGQTESEAERQQLVDDYFTLSAKDFADKYPDLYEEAAERPLTQQDYEAIMGPLNPAQQAIVEAEDPAIAVIAGPGSGKTRTIVHRIAYLIQVKRVNPDRILVLAYNRNAVRELRLRLQTLVGSKASRLRVYTFHGLALSLLGRTLEAATNLNQTTVEPEQRFQQILQEACDLIESGDPEEAEEAVQVRRTRLLGNTEHIFVDEYQDVAEQEYRLIRLIAGLGDSEDSTRSVQINLCVIGDDDQNIYAFRGTNPNYIRQFRAEYQAKQFLLTENYRSTEAIIAVANQLIQHNTERYKRSRKEQVRIDEARIGYQGEPVQALRFNSVSEQAIWIAAQVQQWHADSTPLHHMAILARQWDQLKEVRALLEKRSGIATFTLKGRDIKLVRRSVTQQLLAALEKDRALTLGAEESVCDRIRTFFQKKHRKLSEPTVKTLLKIAEDIDKERGYGSRELATPITTEEIKTAIYEFSESPNNALLDEDAVLVTSCHGAKGLEFTRVILLTDGFSTESHLLEEERRLFYVAMTRARESLALSGTQPSPFLAETQLSLTFPSVSAVALPRKIYYADLTPGDVNLGYPATQAQQAVIQSLREGDSLRLQANRYGNGWVICTVDGLEIGALSKAANQLLKEQGMLPSQFQFEPDEVTVRHVFRHLKIDEVTYTIQEDWFVAIPQIRVYR